MLSKIFSSALLDYFEIAINKKLRRKKMYIYIYKFLKPSAVKTRIPKI